ncbi:hypothetical protein [Chryseobacterium gregarium]|uniref:hypothetical protein n=1 Tax=Chryseobacterium gregarium TaxID=456299 RepID=UPI00040550EA|nr:hypothetical protein [Chryseobacterium gregarium]
MQKINLNQTLKIRSQKKGRPKRVPGYTRFRAFLRIYHSGDAACPEAGLSEAGREPAASDHGCKEDI